MELYLRGERNALRNQVVASSNPTFSTVTRMTTSYKILKSPWQSCCNHLVVICMCVCLFYILYYSAIEGVGHRLSALYVKLNELILQIGCPSYHLTSWRKSSLIQKCSAHLPKTLYEYGDAEKTII